MERFEGRNEQTLSQSTRKLTAGVRNVEARAKRALNFLVEIERMWHLKTTIVPVVVGARGMVKKGIQNHLNTIPGEPNLQEIQKVVLTSTTHLLRKALSI